MNTHPNDTQNVTATESSLPTQRIIRGGLGLAIGSYFNIVFGFLANLALTRILDPIHYGTFAYAMTIYGFINLRSRIPVGYGFIRHKETTPELIGTNLALNVTFSVSTLLLAGLAAPVLHIMGESWLLAWLIMALASMSIIQSFSDTASTLLNREFHFAWPSLINSLVFPISYLPAFWLARNGGGPWSLLAQNSTYCIVYTLMIWLISRRKLPHLWQMRWKFDREVAKYLIRFGSTITLGSLAAMLVATFDDFLIGRLVDLDTLGYYDRAYRLTQWPNLLVSSIIAKATIYTYAHLQKDPVRLKKAVTMSLWLITTLGLPLALAIFISAPDLISLLYTSRWLPSAQFVRFLAIYSVIQPLLSDAGTLFVAIDKPKLTVITSSAEAVTLILAGTLLTIGFGAIGTSIAVGIAYIVGMGITYYFIRQVIALNLWQTWGVPILAAAIIVTSYLVFIRLVDMSDWLLWVRVLVKVTYSAIGYLTLLLVIQPRETIEKVQYIWRLGRGG